jgi:uncharacterized protein (DUF427 family)
MKAIWNEEVLAESEDTVLLEGNHYFPLSSLKKEYMIESDTKSTCPWKGTASYYHIKVGQAENKDAAWYYAEPKPKASSIKGRVAFWKGVEVKP